MTEEFCPNCGRFVTEDDFSEVGWCHQCVVEHTTGKRAQRCKECGRWFGADDSYPRCSSCRHRDRQKLGNRIHKIKRCVRCGAPFRQNRGLFCHEVCERWSRKFFILRQKGIPRDRALSVVLRIEDPARPHICVYCGGPLRQGQFCNECRHAKSMYNLAMRKGMAHDEAIEYTLKNFRGTRAKQVRRAQPRLRRSF